VGTEYWSDRGVPWEFDPGPPRNRSWGRLFAETPNYRGLGKAVTGREAFRWHFGPMFYRGRLWDRSVKVLIIGQEGAQDESLAGRSFVGGTGARMQHFLRHLGITRSYLFLNTFVYPIFGQYTDSLRGLAQDPRSPIARHRNQIFDYVLARNDVHLVVAVGVAAKESVVTWVKSRGGVTGSPLDLTKADASVLGSRVRLLGVVHPGSASQGNGSSGVKQDFIRAAVQVEEWSSDDPTWLPPDPGVTRQPAQAYEYKSAPIPFRDLPFGVCWRLGRGGTSSNRSPDQRAIQLFGAGGNYNGRGDVLVYSSAATGSEEGYVSEDGDLPYEPPRRSWRVFDSGPSVGFARLLQGGVAGLEWPDFGTLGLPGDGSFGSGPMYRGRWSNVKAVVLADQQSHDDVFSGRALCGEAGQRLQGFLEAMGVARDYLIIRVLPVDTLGSSLSAANAAVDHPQTRALHTELLRRIRALNPTVGVLLAVGPQARRLVPHLGTDSLPVVEMKGWRQSGARADWELALERLKNMSYPTDTEPTFAWDGRRRQIPSGDLPFGFVKWRASSGDRVVRPSQNGSASPHYLKLFMPSWAFRLTPRELTASEQAAADLFR
jgi:uracil-DNA glycosylase